MKINSRREDRRVTFNFSNKKTFRYALRTLRGWQRPSLRRLQRVVDDSMIALDVRVGDKSYLSIEPGRAPSLKPGFLLWQMIGARFDKSSE